MKQAGASANLSVPTLEEKAWRATEPHTPHPRARIEAVAELNRAGIPCGVLIAPLMPGVNDDPKQVEEILELCAEAGAVDVGGIALHLRGEVKELWFEWLRSTGPTCCRATASSTAAAPTRTKEERARLARLARGAGGAPGRAASIPSRRRAGHARAQGVQATLF